MVVLLLLYLGAVDINFLWLFGKSPGYFSGIRDPQTSQASEIYSADGVLIGKFFSENRTPVKYDEVSNDFWRALIDTEDERFYNHMGVDPIGIFGAVKMPYSTMTVVEHLPSHSSWLRICSVCALNTLRDCSERYLA